MNIPDLIDGFITWQSTLPCHANQETPFVDERVFQNRGFAGKRFLSSLPLPLLVPFCARMFKKRKMLQTCGKPYGNACYAGYRFRALETPSN